MGYFNIGCRPGRPSKHRQGDDPVQSAEGDTDIPLPQDTSKILSTTTSGQPKSHNRRRHEIGSAQGSQKAKQKRRRRAEGETPSHGELKAPTRSAGEHLERPPAGEQRSLTKTFVGHTEQPTVGEQRNLLKTLSGNVNMPGGNAARIEQPIGGMNPYGYGLGQFPGGMGQFALAYPHT